MHAPRPTPAVDLPALQNASRVLHGQLLKDAQAVPELGDMLATRKTPKFMRSTDYELTNNIAGMPSSTSYSVFPDDHRVPFQKRRLIGIPESLFQYYNSTHPYAEDYSHANTLAAIDVTTHMGLMPELERVWISIDHNLFLWDYLGKYVVSHYFYADTE